VKIHSEKNMVEAGGMTATRDFTIKAGAHIMSVLSGLYKDPIEAMVREYLTNMHDAYVALRKKNPSATIIPPVLHLPSSLDSTLEFRDYGIGMSYDTVWSVYSQYGNSTKNDGNDEVGGFGLGSKTAFCYNNGQAWTIESRYDGKVHRFAALVGEDGIPQLMHTGSEDTKEHNGVTIKIPIRRQDVPEVYQAAAQFVPYFPMKLTIEGNGQEDNFPKRDYILSGTEWGVAKKQDGHGGVVVVMGNVPYEVESQSVPLPAKYTNTYEARYLLQNSRWDFTVPIGSVDIVPSRDSLKMTDRTKKVLREVIERMFDELPAAVGRMMDSAPTEWDAFETYFRFADISYLTSVVTSFKWKGKTLESQKGIQRTLAELVKTDAGAQVSVYGLMNRNNSLSGRVEQLQNNELTVIPFFESHRVATSVSQTYTFIMIDDTKNAVGTARALIHDRCVSKSNKTGRALKYGHKRGHVILLNTNLTTQQISDFFGGYPVDKIVKASDFKGLTIPKAARASKDTVYRWSGSTWEARVNMPKTGTIYYLPLTKGTHDLRWGFMGDRYVPTKLLQYAVQLELTVDSLYGVKTDDVANLDSSWVNLQQAIINRLLNKIKHAKGKYTYASLPNGVEQRDTYLKDLIETTKLSGPLFDDFMEHYTATKSIQENPIVRVMNEIVHDKAVWSAKHIDALKNARKPLTTPNVDASYKDVVGKYPMLGAVVMCLPSYNYGNTSQQVRGIKQQVLDYIALIG